VPAEPIGSGAPEGSPAAHPPFFFIHVMKAAGTTFRSHLQANFPNGGVYPDVQRDIDVEESERTTFNPNSLKPTLQAMLLSYVLVEQLLSVAPERRKEIRAYAGHFPYVVTEQLGLDLVTLTTLRHPVARTLSYLRMNKRLDPFRDASLDEIYDHAENFEMFIHNHQTKVFSITEADHVVCVMDTIAIDDSRLALAKENLAKVDVVGLAERFDGFLDEVHRRYGLVIGDVPDGNVGEGDWPVSDALRRRIEEDNRADMELYEFACELVAERAHA